jgi:sugar phosphate isomerase/epimerase
MAAVGSARELAWPDLVWSHFSRPRFDDIDARIAAAGAAGFAGIGLFADTWGRQREAGRTVADLAAVLDRHEVVLAEFETARGWWATDGPVHEANAEVERLAFELADGLGLRYLQAIGPYECDVDQAIEGFAAMCDRAAEHGLLVGIEWLPYTNIATAAHAAAIVRGADRPNGGYCVDIWHHRRGADDLAMVQDLEPERIFAVQMNDGSIVPTWSDYKADCLATRLPPGAGEFDCAGFVSALSAMGVTAPISLEVCSAELWSAPVTDAARQCADAMRSVLAAGGVR